VQRTLSGKVGQWPEAGTASRCAGSGSTARRPSVAAKADRISCLIQGVRITSSLCCCPLSFNYLHRRGRSCRRLLNRRRCLRLRVNSRSRRVMARRIMHGLWLLLYQHAHHIAWNTLACVFGGTVFSFIGFCIGVAESAAQPTTPSTSTSSLFFFFYTDWVAFSACVPDKPVVGGAGHSSGKQNVRDSDLLLRCLYLDGEFNIICDERCFSSNESTSPLNFDGSKSNRTRARI